MARTTDPPGDTRREEADDYARIVARLSHARRVIACRDALKWIVQRRAGHRHGSPRWEAVGYFRSRAALIRFCRASGAVLDHAALAALEALPRVFGRKESP